MHTADTRSASPHADASNEEPEIAFEESIPLDGKDPVGESMVEELGKQRESEQKQSAKEPADPTEGEPMPKQFPAS